MSDSESILTSEQLAKIQSKIQLIRLGMNALGIKKSSSLTIPNNHQELNQTIRQIMALVQNNKELIRRACALLEEMKQQQKALDSYGIVKDYWEQFNFEYHHQIKGNIELYSEFMEQLALKILFNLLFYTGAMGENHLQEQLNS